MKASLQLSEEHLILYFLFVTHKETHSRWVEFVQGFPLSQAKVIGIS